MPEYTIRKASNKDLEAVEKIYEKIHDEEEKGNLCIGWIRGIYPVLQTARDAVARKDLFVLEVNGIVSGAAIINQVQVDAYAKGKWMHEARDEDVCVLHTLVISPDAAGKGYGRAFVKFYESYAKDIGCVELRMDTNEKNIAARTMYKKLGYTEVDMVPTVFNGIPDVHLILLEKRI